MKAYYHGSDVILGEFHQFPSILLQSDKYSMLNSDAIVLYSILSKRLQLSLNNGWADENNRIYIYFSREEMAEELRVSMSTIHRTVKKLIEADLLDEVRQGLGKPNRLYLLKPTIKLIEEAFSAEEEDPFQQSAQSSFLSDRYNNQRNAQTCQEEKTRPVNLTCQELSDWHGKEIYNNKKYTNKSSSSDDGDEKERIREKIGYDGLKNSQDVTIVDFIVGVILDIQTCQNDRFRIGCKYFDTGEIKQTFEQINQDAVIHAVEAIKGAEKIANYRNYVVSVLYNYLTSPKKLHRQQEKPKHSINNFNQRTYDYDALMRQLQEADNARG